MVEFLAARSGGDARSSLNALELALDTAERTGEDVTLADAEDAMQRKALRYDKSGDQHYDYISAWIKSTRGSDPDASLYYLAAMLEGGEDARFIARRMVILASEDVGNADPQALQVAVAAAHAVEHVGLPEATFALAQAAIYLSLAPKSNAAGKALGAARAHIREQGAALPPAALRSAAYPAARALGRGRRLRVPARPSRGINDQEHLPAGGEDRGSTTPATPSRRCASGSPRSAPARAGRVSAAEAAARRAAAVVARAGERARALPAAGGGGDARRARRPRAAARRGDRAAARRSSSSRSCCRPCAACDALANDGPRALADRRVSPRAACSRAAARGSCSRRSA